MAKFQVRNSRGNILLADDDFNTLQAKLLNREDFQTLEACDLCIWEDYNLIGVFRNIFKEPQAGQVHSNLIRMGQEAYVHKILFLRHDEIGQ